MTTTDSPAGRATATPLTFAAQRGGVFPAVLTEDHAEVTAPAGRGVGRGHGALLRHRAAFRCQN